MPYLGPGVDNGYRSRFIYTATAGQTSFSGGDANGITLTYTDSEYLDVYQNGVLLVPGDDYTATTGTTVVLVQGASLNDKVEMIQYQAFGVADTVSRADGGAFGGNVTMAGTLGVTGAVTANAGVVVDNITIDGTEIDLSSGDLTIDVAGDINLDADGAQIRLKDGGTEFGVFSNESGDFIIKPQVQDKDLIFKGDDGGSTITALSLDMSEGGRAAFNSHIDMTNNTLIFTGMSVNAKCIQTTASGSHSYTAAFFRNSSGTEVGSIGVTTSGSSFNTSSDYRLKENVNYSFDATTRLKQLKPARFNFIVDADTTVDGFIAHEVSSIVPEAITGEKDATEDIKDVVLKADGTILADNISENKWTEGKADKTYASDTTWVANKTVPKYQGIDQAKLVPLLVKTIQELEARIAALESA